MGKFFKNGLSYEHTIKACFIGYIVQAIVKNFAPLLFLTFQQSYGIPLSRITLLITFNFCVQLSVDLLSAGFIDRIGYRAAMMADRCRDDLRRRRRAAGGAGQPGRRSLPHR